MLAKCCAPLLRLCKKQDKKKKKRQKPGQKDQPEVDEKAKNL
jgi:hypothetical protein